MTDPNASALERRAGMLADRLGRRVDLLANLMRPGDRPVFHERKSEQDALAFWRKHRFDDMGQAVMSTWSPDQVLDLDRRLTLPTAEMGGQPANGTPLL